jgi:hypothetical protein
MILVGQTDANVISTSHYGVHYIRHAGTLVAEVVNLPMTKTKSVSTLKTDVIIYIKHNLNAAHNFWVLTWLMVLCPN